MLTLRYATLNDASILFDWRNDPVTRSNSINEDQVPWDVHVDWLTRSLSNARRLLFVGLDVLGHPIGTSRLDVNELMTEISYTVAPAFRQTGLGHALIAETLKHVNGSVKATVKQDNHASRRILENAGFQIAGEEENSLLVYRRD
jgi:RimJ/RimL family protein N-acetyltransferase